MNKNAIVNALTLALAFQEDMPLADADSFSRRFVEENADLFVEAPRPRDNQDFSVPKHRPAQAWEAGDAAIVREGDAKVAPRFITAQRGADGLTASQRRGVDAGVPLCPNCQEPTDSHLPGCARAGDTPMNPKAVTKAPLPPSA